jgi:hypothetical protein
MTEVLLLFGIEDCLEVNAQKTEYIFMFHEKNTKEITP